MTYRQLTESGDYSFGHGDRDFMQGVDAVAQAIKTRLTLLKGEWWEDTADGLPLFQNILGVRGTEENKRAADLLVQDRIIQTTGTTGVKNFESRIDSKTRKYTISCTVNTLYGEVTIGEVF